MLEESCGWYAKYSVVVLLRVFWWLGGMWKQLGVFRGSWMQFRVLGKSHIVSKESQLSMHRGIVCILEYVWTCWRKVLDGMVSMVWWYYLEVVWLLGVIWKHLGAFRASWKQFRVLCESYIVRKVSKVSMHTGSTGNFWWIQFAPATPYKIIPLRQESHISHMSTICIKPSHISHMSTICIKPLKETLDESRTRVPSPVRFVCFNKGFENLKIQRIWEFGSLRVALLGSSKRSRVWVKRVGVGKSMYWW